MNHKKLRALVLDDEAQLTEILVKTLALENIDAIAANDVDQAIELLTQNQFDLVISDIYLPQKSGKDLFEYALQHFPELPFIFMTGNPNIDTAVDFLKKGAYDYLTKPFLIKELINKIHEVIQRSQKRKAEKSLVADLKRTLQQRTKDFRIYQDIFNSKEDGLLILDVDGLIVQVNPGFCKMCGGAAASWQNKPFTRLVSFFPGLDFAKVRQSIIEQGHWKVEMSAINAKGESWIANLNFFPVKNENSEVFGYAGIISDVTGLRRVENALLDAQEAIIFGMARLAEHRDQETGQHLERIRSYCRALAKAMQQHPDFKDIVTDKYIATLERTAPLHDIGKVGIPDQILLKGDKLTEQEYELIKQHTVIGYQTLNAILNQFGDMDFLQMGIDITYCHHEKYDGTGYPRGLKGDEIPLSAQIVSVADMYDALTSERVYKKAFPHDLAVRMIVEQKGKHFAPKIVEVFESAAEQFDEIRVAFWGDINEPASAMTAHGR